MDVTSEGLWDVPNTWTEISLAEPRYQVVHRGRLVAYDYTTFASEGGGIWYAYAQDDTQVTYPAPRGWKRAQRVRAFDLLEQREADLRAEIADGQLRLRLRGGHPYRVTYGE